MAADADTEALVGLDVASLAGPMEELVELWRRVDALPSLPDAASLSGERALAMAEAIARVRHASDALLAPYAARLDELSDPARTTRFARWKGFPNAAALVSHATGLSVAEAGKLIGLGRVLAHAGEPSPATPAAAPIPGGEADGAAGSEGASGWAGPAGTPDTPATPDAPVLGGIPAIAAPTFTPRTAPSPLAAAIRAGTLGTEKANIIRRTLEDMVIDTAATERFLVERGLDLSLVELRRLCLTTLAERDPAGLAAREERQRNGRYLKIYEEIDGMVTIFAKLDPVSAAPIKAWFDAEMQAEVAAQRDARIDQQRNLGQIYADLFVTTARHAAGCDRAAT